MEFSEFSDTKGCLMTLYSDAGAIVTIRIAILIVERISVTCLLYMFYRRIDFITIVFLLHVGKRTLTQRSLH